MQHRNLTSDDCVNNAASLKPPAPKADMASEFTLTSIRPTIYAAHDVIELVQSQVNQFKGSITPSKSLESISEISDSQSNQVASNTEETAVRTPRLSYVQAVRNSVISLFRFPGMPKTKSIVIVGMENSGKTKLVHALLGQYSFETTPTLQCELHLSHTLRCGILDSAGFSNTNNRKNELIKRQIEDRARYDIEVCIVILLQVYRSTRMRKIPQWIEYLKSLCVITPKFVVCDVSGVPKGNYKYPDCFKCLKFKNNQYSENDIKNLKSVLMYQLNTLTSSQGSVRSSGNA